MAARTMSPAAAAVIVTSVRSSSAIDPAPPPVAPCGPVTACDTSTIRDTAPACDAATAAVCAQEQGKFWAFHDLAYKIVL